MEASQPTYAATPTAATAGVVCSRSGRCPASHMSHAPTQKFRNCSSSTGRASQKTVDRSGPSVSRLDVCGSSTGRVAAETRGSSKVPSAVAAPCRSAMESHPGGESASAECGGIVSGARKRSARIPKSPSHHKRGRPGPYRSSPVPVQKPEVMEQEATERTESGSDRSIHLMSGRAPQLPCVLFDKVFSLKRLRLR